MAINLRFQREEFPSRVIFIFLFECHVVSNTSQGNICKPTVWLLNLGYWHFNIKRLKLLSSEVFIMQDVLATVYNLSSSIFCRQDCICHLQCKSIFYEA